MLRFSKFTKQTLLGILLSVPILFTVASPVAAQPQTFLHNNKGKYVPACSAKFCSYGPDQFINNGTKFYMHCYADGPWRNGNYNSNRWFKGYIYGKTGQYWVPSSYVFFQIKVGRC